MLNAFRLGYFGKIKFLLYLWSSYYQSWHDGTLGQKSLKNIKKFDDIITMKSYDVIKLFSVLVEAKLDLLSLLSNLAEIWHKVQV